jgi:hypothetical protein
MAVGGRGGGEGEDNDDEVEYHELTHSSISPSLQTVHDVNAFFHSIQIGDLYVPQKQGLINDGSNAAISSKKDLNPLSPPQATTDASLVRGFLPTNALFEPFSISSSVASLSYPISRLLSKIDSIGDSLLKGHNGVGSVNTMWSSARTGSSLMQDSGRIVNEDDNGDNTDDIHALIKTVFTITGSAKAATMLYLQSFVRNLAISFACISSVPPSANLKTCQKSAFFAQVSLIANACHRLANYSGMNQGSEIHFRPFPAPTPQVASIWEINGRKHRGNQAQSFGFKIKT